MILAGTKDRVFISEGFRFEDLGFEMVGKTFIGYFSAISKLERSTLKRCDFGPCKSCAESLINFSLLLT